MNYKISVIVATYNSGDFLNEFLDSIISQSLGFEDIEVIFVDDASTDTYTLELLHNFDEMYSNVLAVFLDENSGFPGTGRNRGLDLDHLAFEGYAGSVLAWRKRSGLFQRFSR